MSPTRKETFHVGWEPVHPDTSMDYQLSRWAAYGGPRWLADLGPDVAKIESYEQWIETFVGISERAQGDGRLLHAALHLRCAEFFMLHDDPRKPPARKRILDWLRESSIVPSTARRTVSCGGTELPVWDFDVEKPKDTIVVFGGFDSYVEEFFPVLSELSARGLRVIAFEGPGQGSVLEDAGMPMDLAWERPVGAVLDAFGLDNVTLVGISLGGCLVLRAAAAEPRIRRAIAFDVLSDFGACFRAQVPAPLAVGMRALVAFGPDAVLDRAARMRARVSPVAAWGLAQAMHVFGVTRPSEALARAQAFNTHDVSARVTQDVLLMAGAEDHYVPVAQLWQQAQALVSARSVSTRLFTRQEHAQAHCQVSNVPLALDVMCSWLDTVTR